MDGEYVDEGAVEEVERIYVTKKLAVQNLKGYSCEKAQETRKQLPNVDVWNEEDELEIIRLCNSILLIFSVLEKFTT